MGGLARIPGPASSHADAGVLFEFVTAILGEVCRIPARATVLDSDLSLEREFCQALRLGLVLCLYDTMRR